MHYRLNGVGSTDNQAQFIVALVNKFPTHEETVKILNFGVEIDHRLLIEEQYEICEAKLREFGYDIEGRA